LPPGGTSGFAPCFPNVKQARNSSPYQSSPLSGPCFPNVKQALPDLARCGQAGKPPCLPISSLAASHLAFLTSSKPCRTLPDADKQVNLLAFLFLLWRLRTLLSLTSALQPSSQTMVGTLKTYDGTSAGNSITAKPHSLERPYY
jgi:hypothetical protein